MSSRRDKQDLSSRQSSGRQRAGNIAGGADTDVRVVGVSRRIWVLFGVLVLLASGVAFAFFRSQGALDSTSTALRQARNELAELRISLKHANEATENAMADKELLVKELAAQGEKLAEISLGEEQAKTEAERASSGVKSARQQVKALSSRLEQAQRDVTALQAELEVTRTELRQALEEIVRLKREAAPYTDPAQSQNR